MKDKDLEELIKRLQGFDADELTEDMTDGLEQWCRQREQRGQMLRRVVAMLVVLVMLSAAAMTLSPELRHGIFHTKVEPTVEESSPTPPTAVREAPVAVDTADVVYDTVAPVFVPQEVQKTARAEVLPQYDFAIALPLGDSLYCKVIRVAHSVSVSVQGAAMHPAGALVLPAVVEHDGLKYEVTTLADSALAGCRELTSVTLPPTLSFIGNDAFNGCSALDTLYTLAVNPPRIKGEWCFWEVPQEAALVVPCRSGTAYRQAHCWDWFDTIVDTCEASPLNDDMPATIKFNGSYLIVEGVFGEVVRVFDFEGRLITSELCNGQCRINLGNGIGYHHTSAFLVQVGERPAVKVSAPVRNNTNSGFYYPY